MLAAVTVLIPACDDLISELLKFNSQWYSEEFSIETDQSPGEIEFVSETVYANVDSVLEENGVTMETIKSIRMSDARITILTEDQTFDPVSSLEMFIETPTLGKTRIAWLDSVPIGARTIDLDLNKDDLKDYIVEESFIFSASGNLVTKVEKTIDCLAEFRYVMQGGLEQ
jgi:hypothetical protein